MTTISVIIPAYNAQHTIVETVQSVQQQTFKDIEIIVINDGSTDQTSNTVKSIEDSRIRVFDYSNGGVSTARNRGIAQANGKYISFIDADDLWTTDKLEKQLAALQKNPQAGVAYSWIAIMLDKKDNSEEASFFSGRKVSFEGNIYSQLLLENFIANGSNILAKREAIAAIGEFNSSLQPCEDWDFYLRLAANYRYVLVPEFQILYRKSLGTLSTNGLNIEASGLKVIEKTYRIAPKKLQSLKNKSIAKLYILCGRIYFDNSCNSQDIIQAKQRLWKAIKFDPLILCSQDASVLLIKILLEQLLPQQVVRSLISILKKPFKVRKFR